jgi:hypothetical protein
VALWSIITITVTNITIRHPTRGAVKSRGRR